MMIAHGWLELLVLLLAAHFLFDFPLQGDFLANAKNRHTPVGAIFWPFALPGHALIHGAAVMLLTGSTFLGALEFTAHGITDFLKCENKIGPRTDQAIHIGCKLLWFAMLLTLPAP